MKTQIFNLNKMHYSLYLFVLNINTLIIGLVAKTIEDPVAKHDAKQCAIYLCSRLPDIATSYIESGCLGNFKDYINDVIKPTNLNLENIKKTELIESISDTNSSNYVELNTLFYMITFSLVSSMALGYLLRNTEKTSYRYWMVQQKEF